jgi:predicted regulator of Ras-like GTPase activity (Roadblock/LC7/MglB family)
VTDESTSPEPDGEPHPEPGVEDLVREQLRALRSAVRSVTGSLVATSDGLMVAADLPDRPEQVAALTATLVGLARYAVDVTCSGALTETVARGTDGYVAAFALDASATLTVVAEADLNVAMLHHKLEPIRERLAELSQRFVGFADIGLGDALPGAVETGT